MSVQKKKHSGIIVPMVTPFTANRELDETAVCRLIEHILKGGGDGIFVLGTTGEALSMPFSMRKQLVTLAKREVGEKGLLYSGIADNCLQHSLELAAHSYASGVDAVVAHPPFYYPIEESVLFEYYEELADRVESPLLIYNIPQTTNLSVPLEIVERLHQHPNIIGIKDSANNAERLSELITRLGGKDDFSILIGCTGLSEKVLNEGADGLVPSSANFDPLTCRQLTDCVMSGDKTGAAAAQIKMNQVVGVFQKERAIPQSLAALKTALNSLGLCEKKVLPPLVPLSDEDSRIVIGDIQNLGEFKAFT